MCWGLVPGLIFLDHLSRGELTHIQACHQLLVKQIRLTPLEQLLLTLLQLLLLLIRLKQLSLVFRCCIIIEVQVQV